MRVISGTARHIILDTLDDLSIRPTTDKIKETLFNIIQFKLQGINFLDLFAGSGAIGIEALSRNAKHTTFVDNNRKAIEIIEQNLKKTKLIDKSEIIMGDAILTIYNLKKHYDIVFLDPPYDSELYLDVFNALRKTNIIDLSSMLIAEARIKYDFSDIEKLGFIVDRVKEYKNKKHVFLHRS